MIYILDTNIIRKFLSHFPKKGDYFKKIWNELDRQIENGSIISVDECFNELSNQFSKDTEVMEWIKHNKKMFLNPNNEESKTICEIFKHKKFQESIHVKNILENRPSADAYLVAKAKALGATIVTTEEYKPNSAQIPNICMHFSVPIIGYDEFMMVLTEHIDT